MVLESSSLILNHPNILTLAQSLDLSSNTEHPVIPFRSTSSLEYHTATLDTQLIDPLQCLPLTINSPARIVAHIVDLLSLEPALSLTVPDDESSHCILIGARPLVFKEDSRQSMRSWVVGVECPVLVEKIILRN